MHWKRVSNKKDKRHVCVLAILHWKRVSRKTELCSHSILVISSVQNERGNEHLETTSELYLNRQDTNAGAYGCYILDMDETGNAIS
jgi:hypothetical protein